MLPAANHLRRAADFTDTNRRGARSTRGHVTAVVALPRTSVAFPSSCPPQVGLVVGRRVGGSVVRHRVSRRLRAAAASVLVDLPAGSTVVLRAHPGADADASLARDAVAAIRGAAAVADRRSRS